MLKSIKNKNKKKKGFTLVELIAVIAIIGILAAILVPSISGYLTKAKKTKVIEQSRQYVMACEAYNAEKPETKIGDDILPAAADAKISDIVPSDKLNLIGGVSFGNAKKIVNEKAEFYINDSTGVFEGMGAKPAS